MAKITLNGVDALTESGGVVTIPSAANLTLGTGAVPTAAIQDDAVTTAKIPDDAVTSAKLASDITLTGDYVGIPSATTTERDALTGVVGMLIYNSTIGMLQQYNALGWSSIDSPPTVSSLDYPGDDTALDTVGEFALASSTTASGDATITVSSTTNLKQGMAISGTGIPSSATVLSITNSTTFELSANATATGSANVTLTCNTQTLVIAGSNFQAGVTVSIDGTAPSTVTRNSSSQITVTGTPAKTAGTKLDGLVITNVSGLSASINVDYSPLPGWSSPASGNILSAFITGSAITEIDLIGGTGTTSYTLTNSLPPGLAMHATTGNITGTITGTTATTYNFTVDAIDAQAQSSPRLFNIISKGITPTGGTITTYTGFRVHTFLLAGNGSSTNIFTPGGAIDVDYLIIAGGGAGGNWHAGGGGAGGVRTAAGLTLAGTAYTIVVGDGGGGGSAAVGSSGGISSMAGSGLTTITATGGGRGGLYTTTLPADGGSGAGGNGQISGSYGDGADGINDGGTFGTATYQGHDGGDGQSGHAGGGGGGAGAVGGSSADGANAGDGGIGTKVVMGMTDANSTLLLTNAGIGELSGGYRYVAGGGGGGVWSGTSGDGGLGSSGVSQSKGSSGSNGTAPVAVVDNMGAGGSGSGAQGNVQGWPTQTTGGSGVVIIRYAS